MAEIISNDTPGHAAEELGDWWERGLEPAQPTARYETDLSSVLAFAPRDTPLEVLQIADDVARGYCAQLGLEPGDQITRHDGLKNDVLLSTKDGRRFRLALPVALLVQVEPAIRS
jgi:hypothetical protein